MGGEFLDLETWPRREHYAWFKAYELPFFGVCAEVEVGPTLRACRESGASFFLAGWYVCQQALQACEPFRLRIRGERVWRHDRIEVASTVLNPDKTFSFCYLPYGETFEAFARTAQAALDATRAGEGGLKPADTRDDLIHGTVLPWLRFTSITHAQRLHPENSVPRIAYGRYAEQPGGAVTMPVSVEVHHALVDGLDVARFYEVLEAGFREFTVGGS